MSNKNLNCKITLAEKTKLYSELASVTLPTKSGQMQILPSHAESFVLIEKGNVILKKTDGQEEIWPADKGQCHIKDDEVVVIL
jgi:F0F1-type ATP synthase epsilon subunit